MITTRELPLTEWAKLQHCPALPHDWHPLPPTCHVSVAEEDGQIIGAWLAVPLWHMEGFWIHPDHRKKSRLPIRLIRTMRTVLAKHRIFKAFCWTDCSEVAQYLDRLGMPRLPFTTHAFYVNQPDAYDHTAPHDPPASSD